MNNERGLKSNPGISEEAAEWLIEFRSGDIDSRGRGDFDAWLRASPEHLRAFIEMAALWQGSASIDPGRKLRIEDLIVRAKAESNVIDLDLDSSSSARNGRPLHASAEQEATSLPAKSSQSVREDFELRCSRQRRPCSWL